VGRWINPDCLLDTTDAQGLNLYAYCGNDPVNHSDPTGATFEDAYYGWVAQQQATAQAEVGCAWSTSNKSYATSTSDAGKNFIKYEENRQYNGAVILDAYKVAGDWTIGWGHDFDAKGETVVYHITEKQAQAYLDKDILAVEREIKIDLTQNQYDAVVDFGFQMGQYGKAFNGLIQTIKNKGDVQIYLMQYTAGGHNSRRVDEWNVYNNGIYAGPLKN